MEHPISKGIECANGKVENMTTYGNFHVNKKECSIQLKLESNYRLLFLTIISQRYKVNLFMVLIRFRYMEKDVT